MKTRLPALFLFISLLLTACAASATPTSDVYVGQRNAGQSFAATSAPAAPAKSGSGITDVTSNLAPVSQRLVIKNASLEIVVESPSQAMETIASMAEQMGGFVVSSSSFKTQVQSGADVPQSKISVRVPAANLDEALAKIRGLVKNADQDIRNENITGQDVTEDYTDLNSRLINLEATEKQLQTVLEGASKTEDVLAVFRELTNIRQEIEVIKGKMKYFEQSADLSVIDVNILAQASIAPIVIAGWQPLGIARDAVQALIEIGKFLLGALIWIVIVFLPLGLVFYFPIRLLRKWLRRNRGQRKLAPPAAPLPEVK